MDGPESKAGLLRTAVITVTVCLFCSMFVSTTSVLLRPRQEANRERERRQRVLDIVNSQPGLANLLEELGDSSIEARVVELETGAYADWIDQASLDPRRAALDPLRSVALKPERDLAGIGRLPRYATVYIVQQDERIELVILPVYGRGYASTMFGYVALAADGNTIRGLTFYEHNETPGLGADIEDPDWQASWVGKRVRDDQGNIRIRVASDEVDPESEDYPYAVDGIGGATKTCNGVTGLLRFWLGDDGFALFLRRIQP